MRQSGDAAKEAESDANQLIFVSNRRIARLFAWLGIGRETGTDGTSHLLKVGRDELIIRMWNESEAFLFKS
jgi:hypothetical protein